MGVEDGHTAACPTAPVALLSLPWLEPWHAPIGLSVVAGCLRQQNLPCSVRYPNLELYSAIVDKLGDEVAAGLFGNGRLAELLIAPLLRRIGRSEGKERLRFLAPLKLSDHQVRKILQLLEECIDSTLAAAHWPEVAVCGVSLGINQTAVGLLFARRLRERHPHVRIALGGSQCSDPMGVALLDAFDFIDAVGRGECDASIAPLFKALLSGQEPAGIANVAYRWHGRVHINVATSTEASDFGTPDYRDFRDPAVAFLRRHSRPISYYVEGSRGCWWGEKHHCTFCGIHAQEMRSRSKPSAALVAEVVQVAQSNPAINIAFSDTLMPQAHLREVVPVLSVALADSDVELFADFKPNLSKKEIASLAAAGFTGVQFGIESFSDRLLKVMRKGAVALQNVQALKWCTEAGVGVFYGLLIDVPGEQAADYVEQQRIMGAISHLQPPSAVFPIEFDRFSPYFDRPEEFGIGSLKPHRMYGLVYGEAIDLRRFAYVFEPQAPQPRPAQLLAARQAVIDCVESWTAQYERASLTYWLSGDRVFIARSGQHPHADMFEGLAAQLFLSCDRIRRRSRLAAEFAQRGLADAQAWIDRFIDEGFILASASGEHVLALPLRRARLRPPKGTHDEDPAARHPSTSARPATAETPVRWDLPNRGSTADTQPA